MSRRDDNPLDEAEALLEGHGIPHRRLSFSQLQVEDLVLEITGTLRIDGALASLPNAGVHGLLRRQEAFCRDHGVARPLSAPPGSGASRSCSGRVGEPNGSATRPWRSWVGRRSACCGNRPGTPP